MTGDRPRLSRRSRNALLTAHIIVAVGLLGDSAGFLAVAVRGPDFGDDWQQILRMFAYVFGIPLSFAALLTGLALAFTGRWSLRTPWVAGKLALILTVIAAGALVIDPALDSREQAPLIAASLYDVIALAVATGLAVFKPGRAPGRR